MPDGHVGVTWEQQSGQAGGRRLHLVSVEAGGPPVVRSGPRGFGTRLINDGLAYELDGQVTLEFDTGGVRCAIDVPLIEPEAFHDRP